MRSHSSFSSSILVLSFALIAPFFLNDASQAACRNYLSYVHYVGGVRTPGNARNTAVSSDHVVLLR
jgi:hypothetical protein